MHPFFIASLCVCVSVSDCISSDAEPGQVASGFVQIQWIIFVTATLHHGTLWALIITLSLPVRDRGAC